MTFTFTIDAFPAYTKFNKTKKVMAALQIIDPTIAHHNYANKEIIGHNERTADDDTYFTGLYTKEGESAPTSVFDQVTAVSGGDESTNSGSNGQSG